MHLVAVFMFMQFMQLRYVSRRNRYSREAWGKLSAIISLRSMLDCPPKPAQRR